MAEPPVTRWRVEIARDPRRVVVIDDDPTGTQAVSGWIVREVRLAARRAGAGEPAILLRGDSGRLGGACDP